MEFLELLLAAKSGDKQSRDLLVEKNMGLVWSVVRRFAHRGYEMEDLFQIGVIGLMKAIDYFDTSYDVKFSTYAVPMISGEIKRFLRDDGMIKVSRSLKEHSWKIQKAREQLHHEQGREASLSELCACTGLEPEDVITAMESGCEVESLNKVIFQNDGQPVRLVDKLVEKKDSHGELLDRLLIEELLDNLDAKERELIILRYYCNETQSRIAEYLGVSQVQVSRMEKRVLRLMREIMNGS
ncbi:SigF/SigG family RNA polymerase sporulation sigma factor [Frisingicoccus sp.]|uniref:SigF/SigG family RNA polymerase sporulation sigma factor n=1 Tax=Frisingicoccus sp. TaxID=1918627 RepID=UPI002EBE5CD8|nr:SigF/SigG family RNA polymerase sporulation sigma factor [Frisingicoccus sp.]